MGKNHSRKSLRKQLLAIPEAERQALIRRATLRSVDGNDVRNEITKDAQVPERYEILRQPAVPYPVKKDSISKIERHRDCSPTVGMKAKPTALNRTAEIFPISNFPPVREYDGGVPEDATVIEIFTLRRDLNDTRRDLRAANKKISRAIEALHSIRRFIRLGLYEHQWETNDELSRRLSAIEGTLKALDDPCWGIEEKLEIPERWKKRD